MRQKHQFRWEKRPGERVGWPIWNRPLRTADTNEVMRARKTMSFMVYMWMFGWIALVAGLFRSFG